MRDLRNDEMVAVSGGTFGLLSSIFSCFRPQPAYCAPKPVKCDPAPKCAPAPKCDPKPKKNKGC